MKMGHTRMLFFTVVIFIFLFQQVLNQIMCSTSSNCTGTTPNAFCASQGYCSCTPGFIFSCNTPATTATTNSFLTPLTSSRPYYYIMSSQVGVQLQYTVTFFDATHSDILATYQPEFYTDEGMTISPQITYTLTSVNNKPNYFYCIFRITLTNKPGTEQPESLILMIDIPSPFITPSLTFTYSYTTLTTSTPIFLILGYIAGGLLILTSIVLIVVVYRKKRTHRRRGVNDTKEEPIVFDILHFDQFMPASLISVQDRKTLQICSVCLQEFDFNATVRKTLCQHVFHTACLDQWCVKNLSCPNCRTDLSVKSLNEQRGQMMKKDNQIDWIVNSLAEDEEPSQIRNPLNHSGNNYVLDNSDL